MRTIEKGFKILVAVGGEALEMEWQFSTTLENGNAKHHFKANNYNFAMSDAMTWELHAAWLEKQAAHYNILYLREMRRSDDMENKLMNVPGAIVVICKASFGGNPAFFTEGEDYKRQGYNLDTVYHLKLSGDHKWYCDRIEYGEDVKNE